MPAYHITEVTKTGTQWNVTIAADQRCTGVPAINWYLASGSIGALTAGREFMVNFIPSPGLGTYQGFTLQPAFVGGGGDPLVFRVFTPKAPAILATPSPTAPKVRLVPALTAAPDSSNPLHWRVTITWPTAITGSMVAADLALHGCTLDNLAEITPGLVYRATLVPTGYGSVGLAVRPRVRAAASDGRKNDSAWWAWLYQTTAAQWRPRPRAPQHNIHWYPQALDFDLIFPRSVSGLALDDIEAENIDTLTLSGSGASYRVQGQPTVERGWTKLRLKSNAVADQLGNSNPLLAEWASYRDPEAVWYSPAIFLVGFIAPGLPQYRTIASGMLQQSEQLTTYGSASGNPQTTQGTLALPQYTTVEV